MSACTAADESSQWCTRIQFKNQKNRTLRKTALVPFNSNLTLVNFILERIAGKEDQLSKEGNYTSDDITEIMCCKGKGPDMEEYSIIDMKGYSFKQFMSREECQHTILTVTLLTLEESRSGPLTSVNDYLMVKASEINYLNCSTFRFPFLSVAESVDKEDNENSLIEIQEGNIQQQTKEFLKVLLFQLGIGFTDSSEERKLQSFVNSYSNVLCFIINRWKRILGTDFPNLPGAKSSASTCMVLLMLAFVDASKRSKSEKTNNRLTTDQLDTQVISLERLPTVLPSFKSRKALQKSCEILKKDISLVTKKITALRFQMVSDYQRKQKSPSPKKRQTQISSAIISPNSHVIVEPAKSKSGRRNAMVENAIKTISSQLSGNDAFYKPFSISDDLFQTDIRDRRLRDLRSFLKDSIRNGVLPFAVCIHTHIIGGSVPDICTIFKIQNLKWRRSNCDEHANNLLTSIAQCKDLAPRFELQRATKEITSLLATLSGNNISSRVMKTVKMLIMREDEAEDKDISTLISSGVINLNVLQDLRSTNSRGNAGEGVTKFSAFYNKCRSILRSVGAAHERRTAGSEDILYGSQVTSIPNLRKQTVAALNNDIVKGTLKKMPPIPSDESIRLQFVPSSGVVRAAAKLTGNLGVKRCIQLRTIHASHQDQHWVNSFTKYHKEWLIELKRMVGQSYVMFTGQDDKAKISVGDHEPVSTGVHIKHKAIVSVIDEENMNKAADHDWSKANIIPSVTLLGNIPDEIEGSFYSGGPDGTGEIHVTLRDATFDPSNIFDHCAQLYTILLNQEEGNSHDDSIVNSNEQTELKGLTSLQVLLLQTDGGPDHNLTFLRTKMALVALFVALDVDHLVALRGAPHGSYLNTVERCMSLLNLGLQNLALKRKQMAPWAEAAVANIQSMASVRKYVDNLQRDESTIKRSRQIGQKKQTTLFSQGQTPSNTCIAFQSSENPSILRVHNAKTKELNSQIQSHDSDKERCSYGEFCQLTGSNTLKLESCAIDGCTNKSHDMCQGQYACSKNLKERDGQPQKKICFHHLSSYYHTDSSSNLEQPTESPTNRQEVALDNERNSSASRKETSLAASQLPITNNTNDLPTNNQKGAQSAEGFKKEWAKSMALPISQISKRFEGLELSGRGVKVEKRCSEYVCSGFHNILKSIDEKYDSSIRQSSKLNEMPTLKKYIDNHIVITPYSISIQKCGKASCTTCTAFKSTKENRELVLQRQPTPQKKNSEHFFSREEALLEYKGQVEALTNFNCLPSKSTKPKVTGKSEKKKRDTAVGKLVSKWAACNVRETINCETCMKPRCLFSKTKISEEDRQQIEKKGEANQYICGHLLFPTSDMSHRLKDSTIVQRINLTCADAVEKEYYNPLDSKRSHFQTETICALCTSKEDILFQADLEKLNVTEGYPCLPLCQACNKSGSKPAKKGQKPRRNYQKNRNQKLNNKRNASAAKNNAGAIKKPRCDTDTTQH